LQRCESFLFCPHRSKCTSNCTSPAAREADAAYNAAAQDSPRPSALFRKKGARTASLVQRPGSSTYYVQFYVSGNLKRKSTCTDSFQLAKEKLRQFESAQARGDVLPLPTKAPIGDVLTAYLNQRFDFVNVLPGVTNHAVAPIAKAVPRKACAARDAVNADGTEVSIYTTYGGALMEVALTRGRFTDFYHHDFNDRDQLTFEAAFVDGESFLEGSSSEQISNVTG
jgi:hypothetical protein